MSNLKVFMLGQLLIISGFIVVSFIGWALVGVPFEYLWEIKFLGCYDYERPDCLEIIERHILIKTVVGYVVVFSSYMLFIYMFIRKAIKNLNIQIEITSFGIFISSMLFPVVYVLANNGQDLLDLALFLIAGLVAVYFAANKHKQKNAT